MAQSFSQGSSVHHLINKLKAYFISPATVEAFDRSQVTQFWDLLSFVENRSNTDVETVEDLFAEDFYSQFPRETVATALSHKLITIDELEWDGAYVRIELTGKGRELLLSPIHPAA
jgi:hypothetical protein